MSIVKHPQYTLKITKLKKLVILMMLLSTIYSIVRICMHSDNKTQKKTRMKYPPPPSYWQNKQSCFHRVNARLVQLLNTRW